VASRAAVFEDPHPYRAQLNGVPALGTGYRYVHSRTSFL
jgi:hypothetical protein